MASIFGHGLVAYTTAKVIDSKSSKLLVFLAISSAMLPDLDVIGYFYGIDYSSPFGHRGLTHSILFAFLWTGLLTFFFGKSKKLTFAIIICLSTLSHGILDAMTSGGRGVGFFIPFDNSRYFLPFRGIKVSPIGIENFFSEWGLKVIWSELYYIGLPCLIILVVQFFIRRK
ncbi:metal-dependent hydrolase [Psychroserpens sp. Hel_I_66]|uniref:metal-dependent hydrolase n=1 Tax=Psychroserpens sp. Hel_I_66 TaxID=1250004 RepID=UPI000645EF6C|nr:metal-dependent hydrolase [Psychroserpens sp. Hel_I_66]